MHPRRPIATLGGMTYLFNEYSGTFTRANTKVEQVDAVVRLLKWYDVMVSPSNVISLRSGDFLEFRCYVAIPGATTGRNKQLAAIVKRNLATHEITVDIK